MTGREIVTGALQEIGVIGAEETPTAADLTLGLSILQRAVNSLGAERLTVHTLLRTVVSLVSGTRDYTIGSGGDINIVRPVWIDHATVIPDSTISDPVELPIAVFSDQQWENVALKTLDSALIGGIYYNRAMDSNSRGTISTYPTVNTSNVQLVLYTPQAIVGFVDESTEYVYPPGYEDAYHYELAYRMQRPFGKPLDGELKEQRDEAWARVKRSNLQVGELTLDAALIGNRAPYNIYSDSN